MRTSATSRRATWAALLAWAVAMMWSPGGGTPLARAESAHDTPADAPTTAAPQQPGPAPAEGTGDDETGDRIGPADQDPAPDAASPPSPPLPHLRVDLERRCVDLEATVIRPDLIEGQWLEVLACTPQGPEHEALLVVKARPSHIHLALLMLGLVPGTPMTWKVDQEGVRVEHQPSGPKVAVTILHERDGQTVAEPASRWLVDRRTGQSPPDSHWLFTGSRFRTLEDRQVYLADVGGVVLSLVNFGDEVLGRPTATTNRNDDQCWGAAVDRVPPAGTAVLLRLAVPPPPPAPPAAENGV